jgi:hypothetical protein
MDPVSTMPSQEPLKLQDQLLTTLFDHVMSLEKLFDGQGLIESNDSEQFKLWLRETTVGSDSITSLKAKGTQRSDMILSQVD